MLKQLEIIGKSGRNWPIKDSREQIALIQACLKASGKATSQEATHNDLVMRNRATSKNVLRDPHASLQLFGNREEIEAAGAAAIMSPYAGNKPRQRDFTEILGDNPKEESDAPFHRPVSPTKSGAGKNHPEMRIYDGAKEDEGDEMLRNTSSDPVIRPDPRKFQHFEFADGSDPQDAPQKGVDFDKKPRTKHDSQWSFDDFTTPAKPHTRNMRSQDIRHWDPENVNQAPEEAVHGRARRDAETHFELQDDGERAPGDVRPAKPRGALHNDELGLYKNQLFDEEDPKSVNQRTLGNITNLKDRGKDFDAHFQMTDRSPAPSDRPHQVPEGKQKAVKMMDHNWEVYEQSPMKKNAPAKKLEGGTHLHIAGDGMGGKKGSSRNWLYGDDDEENVKPAPSRKGNPNAASQKGFWDI